MNNQLYIDLDPQEDKEHAEILAATLRTVMRAECDIRVAPWRGARDTWWLEVMDRGTVIALITNGDLVKVQSDGER